MSKNNDEKHQVYDIPRNLKSAGKIADMVEVTRLVQAIIIAFVVMLLLLKVVHLSYKATFFIMGLIILFTILPYGQNSDTFCRYIYLLLRNFFVRKTYRRYVRHRSLQQKKTIKQRLLREQYREEFDDEYDEFYDDDFIEEEGGDRE